MMDVGRLRGCWLEEEAMPAAGKLVRRGNDVFSFPSFFNGQKIG